MLSKPDFIKLYEKILDSHYEDLENRKKEGCSDKLVEWFEGRIGAYESVIKDLKTLLR